MSKPKISSGTVARSCILVLGMHRSGTSALAGVFSKLGCELPASPMVASASNAKGFFESVAVRDFNEELLASAGSSWDDFTAFHEEWMESSEAPTFLDRAVALLEQEFGNAPLFLLKDPRICRLVPFWRSALERFGCSVKPVLTIRNPLEVSHSLRTKKDFGEPLSQMIWLRHALDAERASRGMTRLHTSFEQLMASWEAVAERAQGKLKLVWPKRLASVEFEVARFLSSDLRHHTEAQARVSASALLPGWLRETYEILNRWAESDESDADHARLDRIRAEFDLASQAFARVIRAERDNSAAKALDAQRLRETTQSEREKLADALASARQRNSELERELAEQKAAFDRQGKETEERIEVLTLELAQLTPALTETRAQLSVSEGSKAQLAEEYERTKADLIALTDQFNQQQTRHERQLAEQRLRLEQQLEEQRVSLERQLEEQRASHEQKFEEQRVSHERQLEEQRVSHEQTLEEQRVGHAAQLEKERTFQAQQLQEHLAAIAELQAELARLCESKAEEIEALRDALQDQRRQVTLIKADLFQQSESRADLEAQLQEVRAELAASRSRRKEMARVIANREARIATLYGELAILQRHMLRSNPWDRFKQWTRRIATGAKRSIGNKPPAQQPS